MRYPLNRKITTSRHDLDRAIEQVGNLADAMSEFGGAIRGMECIIARFVDQSRALCNECVALCVDTYAKDGAA